MGEKRPGMDLLRLRDFHLTREMSLTDIVIFCALFAIFVSFFRGYSFGTNDHIEQLPQIYRAMDSSYCENDFFVNATEDAGPRKYFTSMAAYIARFIPLDLTFFLLTFIGNIGLALVTFYAAREIFNASDFIAMFACLLVMGLSGITPGGKGDLAITLLRSSDMAYPIALLALWQGMKGRAVLCAIIASVACIIHPLIGVEVGIIGIITAHLTGWVGGDRNRAGNPIHTVAALAILAITAFLLWGEMLKPGIGSDQFIEIMAQFRHPHHYIPSSWKPSIWVAVFFHFTTIWLFMRIQHTFKPESRIDFLIPIIAIQLAWICGYVFVELFPSRLWTTAQVFRLAFVLNWLAFLIYANAAVKLFLEGTHSARAPFFILLGAKGNIQPLMAFLSWMIYSVGNRIRNFSPYWEHLIFLLVVMILVSAVHHSMTLETTFCILAMFTVLIWFRNTSRRMHGWSIAAIVMIVTTGFFMTTDNWKMEYKMGSKTRMSEFVMEELPADAVFVVPPMLGDFRITARRAIVVDFKAFPFTDEAMLEWKERIDDCYGEVESTGIDAADEMEKNYDQMTDERLRMLRKKYGADYAVLLLTTRTGFETLHRNGKWRIVKIEDSKSSTSRRTIMPYTEFPELQGECQE